MDMLLLLQAIECWFKSAHGDTDEARISDHGLIQIEVPHPFSPRNAPWQAAEPASVSLRAFG